MKKILSMLCVVLVVGFAGTAFAGKKLKQDVCHNGSKYTGSTEINAVYDPEAWEPGSFVINISGNAVNAHERNHGDLLKGQFEPGIDVVTEVSLFKDLGTGIEYITGIEEQPSCESNGVTIE